MHLESKNAEPLVMAQVEVGQSHKGKISDDSPELVEISNMLARRCLLLRDQHEFAVSKQKCTRGSKLSLEATANTPTTVWQPKTADPWADNAPLQYGISAARPRSLK